MSRAFVVREKDVSGRVTATYSSQTEAMVPDSKQERRSHEVQILSRVYSSPYEARTDIHSGHRLRDVLGGIFSVTFFSQKDIPPLYRKVR